MVQRSLTDHVRSQYIGAVAWNWDPDAPQHIVENREEAAATFDWVLDNARTQGWDAAAAAGLANGLYDDEAGQDLSAACPYRRPEPLAPDMEPEEVWDLALKIAQERGWLSQTAAHDMGAQNPFRRKEEKDE